MINKTHRLRKNFQFAYIYKHGKGTRQNNITCVFVKTKRQPFKVGFSVGKNVGKSVVRSLVKRRMTECFNALEDKFSPAYNYVFVARTGAGDVTYKDMLLQFENIAKAVQTN